MLLPESDHGELSQAVTKEAIALLIELAERGEIDPWDVDVIAVIDRFLSRLVDHDRQGLYDSGQAILYASVLLLLKAQTLVQAPAQSSAEVEEVQVVATEESAGLPIDLEKHLRRRSTAPPPSRKVTLQDLIQQIEEIASAINKEQRPRPRSNKKPTKAQIKAISQLAHRENLSEIATNLEQYFHSQAGAITMTELVTIFNDKVGVFWGLLLLSSQGKVYLEQQDFYGEITVQSTLGQTVNLPTQA